jgi:hypothetical protein
VLNLSLHLRQNDKETAEREGGGENEKQEEAWEEKKKKKKIDEIEKK